MDLDRDDIVTRVKTVVQDQLGVDASEIIEAASFSNDLGADSLDTVELVMALEDEFDVKIEDADAEKILTVGQAVDFILSKKG